MPAPAPGQQAHELGREDLAAGGRRAQAGRLDDGRAEAVAVFERDVAAREADADDEGLVGMRPGRAIGGLLHGDRRRQRVRRAVEHDEQTVTQALDHGAAVRGRVGERTIMATPEALGARFAGVDTESGGTDEIANKNGRRARRHGPPDRARQANGGGQNDGSRWPGRPHRA